MILVSHGKWNRLPPRSTPLLVFLIISGCASSLPAERHARYSFPARDVFIEQPLQENLGRPFKVLGWVRARSRFPTLEQTIHSEGLCRNYYNKAAAQLLKEAKSAGGDAVIQVRSVVFLLSGKVEEHISPECSDDGAEGEILLKGIAIQYLPWPPGTSGKPSAPPAPRPPGG